MKLLFALSMLFSVVMYFVSNDIGFLILAVANQIAFYANEILDKMKILIEESDKKGEV